MGMSAQALWRWPETASDVGVRTWIEHAIGAGAAPYHGKSEQGSPKDV